ncbi:hypothetical protein ASF60_18605 [Methylobacterium sp. Leaf113]|uniref:sensor histidine kinase n=1 Tax=Methylobacterium sp. Leaf113 TaxID=1736259 RepID=UPI0006FE15E8|nr:sensor histidine kinase [Methylobacterium sp. Leaf113]KQP91257.1 hypothetical protein ASF60_18605 [Methylobacterium sp. Leaf113]
MNAEDTTLRQALAVANAKAAAAERRLIESEARYTALQTEQHQLARDLQHHVRNMLAVVRAVAQRSAETSESVEDYAMHLDGRLAALARVQGAMTLNPRAKLDLHALISDELLSAQAQEGLQVALSGPPVLLQPQVAGTLGLVFHELTTNAVKFGALSHAEGRITVSWHVSADPWPNLVVTWREQGGPPVAASPRKGFGLGLLEDGLPYELKARADLRFEPAGLACTIILPLSERICAGAALP